jgi:hypothetical protein
MSERRIVERLRQWPLSEKLAIEAADRIEALEAALREITRGEGRYSRDPYEHACNTIEDFIAIASAALAPEQDKQADDELNARIEEMKRGHGVE